MLSYFENQLLREQSAVVIMCMINAFLMVMYYWLMGAFFSAVIEGLFAKKGTDLNVLINGAKRWPISLIEIALAVFVLVGVTLREIILWAWGKVLNFYKGRGL